MNKPPVTLAIDADKIEAVEGLLLKAKAAAEPAAIAARLEILSDLLRQIEEQRSPVP